MVTTRPPKTIVKPTALGPVANTDTKLLIYGLFQRGRVLAQDGGLVRYFRIHHLFDQPPALADLDQFAVRDPLSEFGDFRYITGEGVRNRDTQNEAGTRSLHRLSTSLQQVFGDFNGRTSLQRSPPRWVHPEFRQRAAAFIRALP